MKSLPAMWSLFVKKLWQLSRLSAKWQLKRQSDDPYPYLIGLYFYSVKDLLAVSAGNTSDKKRNHKICLSPVGCRNNL